MAMLLMAVVAGAIAHGQEPAPVSAKEFAETVTQMQTLVAACEQASAACDEQKASPDVRVGKEGAPGGFVMHWQWLRDAVKGGKNGNSGDRAELMHDAEVRLQEMRAETVDATVQGQGSFKAVRTQANEILARREFQRDIQESLWDRWMQKFWAWVERIVDAAIGIGGHASRLGLLLEWGLFLGAAVGLLIFIFRRVSQQRLRVVLGEGAEAKTAWDREAQDWSKLAEANAAQGDWREAVHGLYWAAIVYLEARRAWRHNPSRTPREYVRLLKPGSTQQAALRGLTQMLERVWYGFGEADAAEYKRARTLFEGLSARDAGAPDASATEVV